MLQRQTISMPLAQGVDTKTDAKQVVAGKLLQLENGIFTTLKAIRKRNGHEQLGNGITQSSETITAGAGLATYNNELLLADNNNLYSYEEATNEWVNKNSLISVQVQQAPVQHDSYFQLNPDGVTASNGLQVYAWSEYEDVTSTQQIAIVKYKIMDSATGQTILPATRLSAANASGLFPRVIAAGSSVLIYYYDTNTLTIRMCRIDINNPEPISAQTSVTMYPAGSVLYSVNQTNPNYDVCVVNDRVVLVFNNNANAGTTGGMGVRLFDINSPAVVKDQTVNNNRCYPVCVTPLVYNNNSSYGFAIACGYRLTSSFRTQLIAFPDVYDLTLKNITTLYSSATLARHPRSIGACQSSAATNSIAVFWDDNADSLVFNTSQDVIIRRAVARDFDIIGGMVVTVTDPWGRGVMLAGRPVCRADNVVYLPVITRNWTQPTFFWVDFNFIPIAKALVGLSANGPSRYYVTSPSVVFYDYPTLPGVSAVNNSYRIAAQELEATTFIAGFVADAGVTSITIEFDDQQHSYQHATLGQNLHFTGGFLQMYDGLSPVEHGFHQYPEIITPPPAPSSSGGNLSSGTYQYTACYEWTDAVGNIHRSAPSPTGTQVVVPAGTTTGSVLLEVPYLQLTAKRDNRSPVRIVVYRTEANGSVFYRASSLTDSDYNEVNGASATLAYNDTLADSDLIKRPQLYNQFLQEAITGIPPEVANDPAPPAELVQLDRNRLWVLDSTNKLSLWYSKQVGLGAPVEFNADFTKQIDPRGGNVTALASMDDKLLVFKDSHIFYILGQGPTSTGQNNDFSDAILVTTDCGCIEPRSVVGTPFGIMFQSRKGIYLISRSLQVDYVGAPVEAFNSETITSATLVANTNQVRFTLGNGKTLVFDYYVQQWGVFTNQNAVDALIWMGSSVLLKANGRVWKETPGLYTDAGAPIKLRLATSWLSFANVQGFQRVRRAQILGAWKSPHKLKVSVCNDFNDAVTQEMIIDPQAYSAYGDTSPYGEDVYGGGFQLYQWRIDLARQKTQAVKFVIEDISAASSGEGMSLTSLAFEVGAKTGLAKVPPSRIYG